MGVCVCVCVYACMNVGTGVSSVGTVLTYCTYVPTLRTHVHNARATQPVTR